MKCAYNHGREKEVNNLLDNEPTFPLRGVHEREDEFEERINDYINYQKLKENYNK